jgi:aryl-alcohol dehydrogenase (NADP+)
MGARHETRQSHGGGTERGLSQRSRGDSLRRLGTDYIDIYYLHKEDLNTPLAETVYAMGDLVRAGKIRYFGVSNYKSWRVAEICAICDRLVINRPVVSQPYYNAMNRMPEVEHLPACAYYGLGVVPYSPLARGVLTGKYAPDAEPPPDTREGRKEQRMLQAEWRPDPRSAGDQSSAEARGMTAGQFAVLWVLNSALAATIAGAPSAVGRLRRRAWYKFTAADGDADRRLVPPACPSTPGFSDPAYPIEGARARDGVERALARSRLFRLLANKGGLVPISASATKSGWQYSAFCARNVVLTGVKRMSMFAMR